MSPLIDFQPPLTFGTAHTFSIVQCAFHCLRSRGCTQSQAHKLGCRCAIPTLSGCWMCSVQLLCSCSFLRFLLQLAQTRMTCLFITISLSVPGPLGHHGQSSVASLLGSMIPSNLDTLQFISFSLFLCQTATGERHRALWRGLRARVCEQYQQPHRQRSRHLCSKCC